MKRYFLLILIVAFAASCAAPLARINGDRPTIKVFLQVEPDTAKVFLDNVYVGKANRYTLEEGGLALTPGVHYLRLEAEGYLTELLEVITAEGMPPIEVKMLERP